MNMITKFNNYSESSRGLKRNLKNSDYEMTKLEVLKTMTNEMPDELLEFIWSWDYIKKSPYSQSWYNAPKGWNGYIDGKLRVADHWNFEAQGKLHCKTKQDPELLKDKWYIGVYDSTDDKFDIVKSYDKKPKHLGGSDFRSTHFRKLSQVLTESSNTSPDFIDSDDFVDYDFGSDFFVEDSDALSLVMNLDTKEWVFGTDTDWGQPHICTSSIYDFDFDKDYEIALFNAIHFGRLWKDSKIIIFWDYPTPEEFIHCIDKLEERLGENVWNNGWRIITSNREVLPVEEFAGSEDLSDELRQKHVAKWQDREKEKKQKIEKGEVVVPKGWGSKSYNLPKDMTPAQYKHLKTFSESVEFGQGENAVFDNDADESFWGNVAAGILVYSKNTKRFLLDLRSSEVNEPNCYGIFGGKLDNNEGIEENAEREFYEETGYNGYIDLIPAFIFRNANRTFEYHNFIGIIEDEFRPRLSWESDGFKWVTFDQLLKIEPKHPGLEKLLEESINIIKKVL